MTLDTLLKFFRENIPCRIYDSTTNTLIAPNKSTYGRYEVDGYDVEGSTLSDESVNIWVTVVQ